MNVLVLAGAVVDHLQDIVHHGLVALLGVDAVAEYPESPRYHGAGAGDDDFPYLRSDLPRRERLDFEQALASADVVVAGSLRPDVLPALRTLLERRARPPVCLLDGADDPYVRGAVRNVDVYFKREVLLRSSLLRARMPLRRLYHRARYDFARDPLLRHVGVALSGDARLVPLPFGIVDTGYRPPPGKDYDVAFLATASSAERVRLAEDLARLESEGLRVALRLDGGRLGWDAYLDAIARSVVAISVRGVGFDTYRYWEIPYAGAALLAETPQIEIPENFVDGEEAVFAPAGRLAASARDLLRTGDAGRLGEAGHRAVLERHTSVARAQTVLERLDAVRRRRSRP